MPRDSPVLPGFYRALFLYIEPLSTIAGTVMTWFFPGAEWFHSQLIPAVSSSGALDAPTVMALRQLGNCMIAICNPSRYSSLSSFCRLSVDRYDILTLIRAIENTLPNNPEAQECILGASMTALAFCDVRRSALVTWIGLPVELRLAFGSWNPMTHGNITFSLFLFATRLAWFAGIGRQRFYYGKTARESRKSA
ncbi:hypothetical protein JVU11DRAFT_9425 [Chiua virens]|nr:hypothetical protein JVU11DRAFT_9425 [Chiua virens]